jgi:hypothetical protein
LRHARFSTSPHDCPHLPLKYSKRGKEETPQRRKATCGTYSGGIREEEKILGGAQEKVTIVPTNLRWAGRSLTESALTPQFLNKGLLLESEENEETEG